MYHTFFRFCTQFRSDFRFHARDCVYSPLVLYSNIQFVQKGACGVGKPKRVLVRSKAAARKRETAAVSYIIDIGGTESIEFLSATRSAAERGWWFQTEFRTRRGDKETATETGSYYYYKIVSVEINAEKRSAARRYAFLAESQSGSKTNRFPRVQTLSILYPVVLSIL